MAFQPEPQADSIILTPTRKQPTGFGHTHDRREYPSLCDRKIGELILPDFSRNLTLPPAFSRWALGSYPQFNEPASSRLFDAATQARVDELSRKANRGQLSDPERREYETHIEANEIIGLLQAKARVYLHHTASVTRRAFIRAKAFGPRYCNVRRRL